MDMSQGKGRESAFVSEFLSRSDRNRRARTIKIRLLFICVCVCVCVFPKLIGKTRRARKLKICIKGHFLTATTVYWF